MKRTKTVWILAVALLLFGCSDSGGITQVGMGTVTTLASSKSADEGDDGLAQGDVTTAVLAVDKEGNIVDLSLDTAQVLVRFGADGQLLTDTGEMPPTKKELGDKYGMRNASDIGKEWFEQIAHLEAWATGKTVQTVVETAPTDPDLVAGCTIDVTPFLNAMEKASANLR